MTTKLKTETDSRQMASRIARAFHKVLSGTPIPAFEHGQWWITRREDGAQWAVNDASGPGSTDGFDFELVTPGEE